MVGYTALGQRNESLSLALVEEQRKLVRPVLARQNGREIKTMGDAFLVEFPSALEAVRCAYEIQRAAREFNIPLPEESRIRLRVGIHLGDVVESGGDISGDAVNVASRIESLADDGGVCLTRQVFDQVQNKFNLQFTSLGIRVLKNVSVPLEVFRLQMPWEEERPTSTSLFQKTRIAVLPFANMSPDPNDEYFADGMTEELISTVSSVGKLSVISRTSVMGYKRTDKKIREIGRELNVGTVLEGSVRKSDNRVRVTVQLVDVGEDKHLWAQSYDRELKNIFELQSDIARKVAEALRVRIQPSEEVEISKQPTLNDEAHLFYLKGLYLWNERTKESMNKAIEYFKRSVEKDPEFALGFAGLALCHYTLAHNQHTEPKAAKAKAKEYITKALELDDRIAEAHSTLSAILFDMDHDVEASELETKKALELKPNFATAHQWYAIRLETLGRFDEALTEFKRALESDPMSPIINMNFADYYLFTKQYDKAIDYYKKTIDLFPDFSYPRLDLARPYAAKSMFSEALTTLDDYARAGGEELEVKINKAIVHALKGDEVEARRLLSEVEDCDSGTVYDLQLAEVHFLLRDDDIGFTLLEKMYKTENPALKFISLLRGFDSVRTDDRFVSLLKKIGLATPIHASVS